MPNFNSMTKAMIVQWAGQHGLDLPMSMTKAEMIAAAGAIHAPKLHMILSGRADPLVLAVDGRVHRLTPGRPLELSPSVRAALADAGIPMKETTA